VEVLKNGIVLDTHIHKHVTNQRAVEYTMEDLLDNKSMLIELVRKGKKGRDKVISLLFKDVDIRRSLRFIVKNHHNYLIDEILTDAIIAFTTQCYKPNFSIHASTRNYIITIARNMYYKTIQNESKSAQTPIDDALYMMDPQGNILHSIISTEAQAKVRMALENLDGKCRNVLLRWAGNQRMRDIAISMDYKSEGMARKKKFQCLQRLKSLLTKNND